MKKPLNLLILNDSEDDAALLLRELSRNNFETRYRKAETIQQMYDALREQEPNIILAAYTVLRISRPIEFKDICERIPHIPIIVISEKVGEEMAVELMHYGARDIIMKSNLARLNSAVERELREAEMRRRKDVIENELRQSQQRLELALKGGDLGLWDINFQTQEMIVNDRWASMLGYTPDEVRPIHKILGDLIHPDDYDRAIKAMKAHGRGETIFIEMEYRLKCKTGEWKCILARGQIVERDRDGKPLRAVGTHMDITRRREAEAALTKSEEAYCDLVKYINDVVYFIDCEGIITYTSPAIRRVFGEDAENYLGHPFQDFIFPEDLPRVKERFIGTLNNILKPEEFRIVLKNSGVRWVRTYGHPVIVDGKVTGVSGVMVDLTERKETERIVSESNSRYLELFHSVIEGIALVDQYEVIGICNAAFAKIFDFEKPEDIMGKSVLEFMQEEQRKIALHQTSLRKQGKSSDYDLGIITVKGNIKTIHISASPRFDQDGSFAGSFSATMDITDRKRADQALRESEEKYRSLVEIFPHIIAIFQDGKTVFVNQSAVRIFGVRDISEILDHGSMDPVPEHEKARLRDYLGRHLAGDPAVPEFYQLELTRADGSPFPVEVYAHQIIYNGRPASQIVALDISERKRAGEELRKSEERYRNMVETANDAICVLDKADVVTFINHRMVELLGYTPEEMIGRPIYSFMDGEGRKVTRAALERRRRGIKENYQNRFVHRNGNQIDVNISAAPLFDVEEQYNGALAMIADITQAKKLETRAGIRNQLFYNLHSINTISECLQMGCQAVQDAAICKRAVFLLKDGESAIKIGQLGLRKGELQAIKNAQPLDDDQIRALTDERHRISHSYFFSHIIGDMVKGILLNAIPEIKIGGNPTSAPKDSSLFIPIMDGCGVCEGWALIAIPRAQGKPEESMVEFIEEIAGIVMMRVREVRNDHQIAESNRRLEEKNLALKEVMRIIETEKEEIRLQVARMIDQTIKPILNRLVRRNGMVNRPHYELLKKALDEIALATGGTMQIAARLSPRELEICALIKGGSSSKDIAETLDISLMTVQKHREVIRRKLGLTNKNINLTTHLRNL
jgi:PAS domain S-box-containing protein